MRPFRFQNLLTAALLGLFAAGCETPKPVLPEAGPRFNPSNTYKAVQKLPPDFRRVAVMPFSMDVESLRSQVPGLQAVFQEELRKTVRFETVTITSADLRQWTGRSSLSASDALPADMLGRIKTNTLADGILFVRIHTYRPFPPVAVGWDARLVTSTTGQTLWSLDEVFDSGDAEVARTARDFFRAHHTGPTELGDPQADLRSPNRFARYSAAAVVHTLPAR